MARVSQWFSVRDKFSDWTTDKRTERNSVTSLTYQSLRVATHPQPMGVAELCVGLLPVAGDVVVLSRWGEAGKVAVAELERDQWLEQRSQFSGWRTDGQDFIGSPVSLSHQLRTPASHPLPMEYEPGVGLLSPGQFEMVETSRFTDATVVAEQLLDYLATEEILMAILTEDTGEPLGLG